MNNIIWIVFEYDSRNPNNKTIHSIWDNEMDAKSESEESLERHVLTRDFNVYIKFNYERHPVLSKY